MHWNRVRIEGVGVFDHQEITHAAGVKLPKRDHFTIRAPAEAVTDTELFLINPVECAVYDCAAAIASFKAVAAVNRTAWGAEARYEMAACQLGMNNLTAAEKAAMSVIKETGSYDLWVTQSYILLGDIFMKQKDYFNAKATYESVASNAVIPELKAEAQRKLDQAIAEEKSQSKLNN